MCGNTHSKVRRRQTLIYMCDGAHTIILLFLTLTVSKNFCCSLTEENAVQLSRIPALSLVRTQTSAANQVGTLLPRIARGDEASFHLFFEATNGLLFGLLLRILGHTGTAEEVLSELYEEVRRRAAQFGKRNERPLTWLILMAHRRAIERLCSHLNTNREKLRTSKAKNKSTSSINITEHRRLVQALLEGIPPLHHRMIELAFFSGMTNLEIAKEVGQSPAVVEAEFH